MEEDEEMTTLRIPKSLLLQINMVVSERFLKTGRKEKQHEIVKEALMIMKEEMKK